MHCFRLFWSLGVSTEKLAVILMGFLLYMTCVFFSCSFHFFSIILFIWCFKYGTLQGLSFLVLSSCGSVCFLYSYFSYLRNVFFYVLVKDLVCALDFGLPFRICAYNSKMWSFGDVSCFMHLLFLCFLKCFICFTYLIWVLCF